jgi:hypothetical protein
MAVDTREAQQQEALRRQQGSHMSVEVQPDARGMGAESAQYTEPTIDPQWIDAWKMFLDGEGQEYGVPVKLPKRQWDAGGPNALKNLRRPDGGFWFQLTTPERVMAEPKYECFVGDCRKKLHRRIALVKHVRAFHFDEAELYKGILAQIERKVADEDPRLQRLLAELEVEPEPESVEDRLACDLCDAFSPEGHPDPSSWLRGHKLGAHKA